MDIVDHSRVTRALGRGQSDWTVTKRILSSILVDILLSEVDLRLNAPDSVEQD